MHQLLARAKTTLDISDGASAVTDASASMPAGTRLPSTATKTADEEDAEAAIFFAPFLRFPVGGGTAAPVAITYTSGSVAPPTTAAPVLVVVF